MRGRRSRSEPDRLSAATGIDQTAALAKLPSVGSVGIGARRAIRMDMATEIISDLELEHIINSLRGCGLDDVGGKEWVEQERKGNRIFLSEI